MAGHVPLADEGGVVASSLNIFKKGVVFIVPGRQIIFYAVGKGILAGKKLVRLGRHRLVMTKAFLKCTPSRQRRSRLGVCTMGCPRILKASHR